MSDNNIKCVFCGEATLQKTIKFTLDTLQKCINILEYRRSKPVFRKSRTRYDNLELSKESSLNEVYHAQCYKLFTAIKIPPMKMIIKKNTQKNLIVYNYFLVNTSIVLKKKHTIFYLHAISWAFQLIKFNDLKKLKKKL